MAARSRVAIVTLSWLLCSCASSGSQQYIPDSSTDTGVDLGDGPVDPGWDLPTDSGWDPATDPAWDPSTDPAWDPSTDPGVDPGTDFPTDPGTDPGYDPGTDPGTDPGYDPGTDPGTGGTVGSACYSSMDCTGVPGSGRMCMTSVYGYVTFPGGYCSATCTSTMDCGTGGSCVDFMGYGNYCLKNCTSTYDCRISEGYSCSTLPSGSGGTYCVPPLGGPDGGPIG